MIAQQLAFDMPTDTGGAVLSDDRRFRYRLWRHWGPGKKVLWCMLNPSTADEHEDDHTICKCTGFARRWGYDGIEVVNLFAARATDPEELYKLNWSGADIVGPENDRFILEALCEPNISLVVAAWGAQRASLISHRELVVGKMLPRSTMCLGRTGTLRPRHPLMLAYATELEPFSPGVL